MPRPSGLARRGATGTPRGLLNRGRAHVGSACGRAMACKQRSETPPNAPRVLILSPALATHHTRGCTYGALPLRSTRDGPPAFEAANFQQMICLETPWRVSTCTHSWAQARIAYPAVELLRRVCVVSRIVIAVVSIVVHCTGAPRLDAVQNRRRSLAHGMTTARSLRSGTAGTRCSAARAALLSTLVCCGMHWLALPVRRCRRTSGSSAAHR